MTVFARTVFARWLPLVLTCSCVSPVAHDRAPTDEQQLALDASLDAWEQRIGPVPDCDPDALQWRTVEPAAIDALCADPEHGPHRACLLTADGESTIVLPVTPYDTWRAQLMTHELAHWLERCSGRWPEGDAEHADAEVWPGQVDAALAEMGQ